MKKRVLFAAAVCCAALACVSCSKDPAVEMYQAAAAVKAAENDADATKYGAASLAAAREALKNMNQAAAAWWRYDEARDFATQAVAAAKRAVADGKSGAAAAEREWADNLKRWAESEKRSEEILKRSEESLKKMRESQYSGLYLETEWKAHLRPYTVTAADGTETSYVTDGTKVYWHSGDSYGETEDVTVEDVQAGMEAATAARAAEIREAFDILSAKTNYLNTLSVIEEAGLLPYTVTAADGTETSYVTDGTKVYWKTGDSYGVTEKITVADVQAGMEAGAGKQ